MGLASAFSQGLAPPWFSPLIGTGVTYTAGEHLRDAKGDAFYAINYCHGSPAASRCCLPLPLPAISLCVADRKGVSPVSTAALSCLPSSSSVVIQMRFRRISFYPLKFFFSLGTDPSWITRSQLRHWSIEYVYASFLSFFSYYFRIFVSFYRKHTSVQYIPVSSILQSNSTYLFIRFPDFFPFLLSSPFNVSIPRQLRSNRGAIWGDANRLNHRISFLSSIPVGLSSTDQ